MIPDPTALAWLALAAANVIAVAMSVASVRRQRRARTVLTAACLDHATTVKRLDAAKAEGRDVIDAAALPLSQSPTARRIREQIADNEVRRLREDLDRWGA